MPVRLVLLGAFCAGILLGGIVVGVRCAADAFDGDSVPAAATLEPGSTPRSTVEAFARAWSEGNIAGLYLLIDRASQERYTVEAFESAYATFATEMTQTSLRATAVRANNDGATLDTRLDTAYFGTFEYSTTIRFTSTPEGPRIAWEPAAIHPDLKNGQTFRSTIQRPRRGAILDRNGTPLAITREARTLGLNRATVQDREALTQAVATLGFTRAQVDQAFASTLGQNQRVPIGRVSDDAAEAAIRISSATPGLLLYFETQRVHPLGPAAAHVVGYTRELTAEELKARAGTGVRPGDRIGATGLEASQDAILAGKTKAELLLEDAGGRTVKVLKSIQGAEGKDVRTTLDATVLQAMEKRMGTRAGAAVVLDPRTNEVIALGSFPSFDPDAFERNDAATLSAITADSRGPLANRATTGLYSAGSTFKLITGAAGFMSGLYRPGDTFFCGASWDGVDPPRRNWEGTQGSLTVALGLMRSCNPVFYEIGLQLYNRTDGFLSDSARAFGFGTATGIAGLVEEDGLVPDAAWKRKERNEIWFPGDEVNLSIGQGDLLITPLQLANAYSAFLHRELRTPVILAGSTAESRGAINLADDAYSHLRLGLQLVTSQTGTASAAFALSGYTGFAGKSGTAEDAGSQQHVLFVAFDNASSPRALAAIVLDDGESGSIEAGPIARDLVIAANAR